GRDHQALRAAAQGARPRRGRAHRDSEGQAGFDHRRVRRTHREDVFGVSDFLQLAFAGLALGSLYALVALGFVVIYKSTGVINFAQGGLVVLGAYLTYNAHETWGLPFALAVPVAMVLCALVGAAVQRVVLRRMEGQPVLAVIMVTIGLLFIIEHVVTCIWRLDRLNLVD